MDEGEDGTAQLPRLVGVPAVRNEFSVSDSKTVHSYSVKKMGGYRGVQYQMSIKAIKGVSTST